MLLLFYCRHKGAVTRSQTSFSADEKHLAGNSDEASGTLPSSPVPIVRKRGPVRSPTKAFKISEVGSDRTPTKSAEIKCPSNGSGR